MGHPAWPLFGLEVRTPRLTLRYLDDELAEELLAVARAGIHDPQFMPFAIPWTDFPSPILEQQALRFYWHSRAETSPESFRLLCAVIVDGAVVGASDVFAADFPIMRQFETGSWLGRAHQGRGLGKEMRLASLTLGFDGLGGEFALTGAWTDNEPSIGVTRSLGYEETGRRRAPRRDQPDEQFTFRMHRSHFGTLRRDDITLHGIDAAREFLGISPRG
jgi:RimJ/RimL family protein N-acetyltransferase